ncbi:MAG: hypothetical protein ACT4N5_08030 [Nitrosopumilaceae archaeon]
MNLRQSIAKKLRPKGSFVGPRIKICVNCGSSFVSINKKKIECKKCGQIKWFS